MSDLIDNLQQTAVASLGQLMQEVLSKHTDVLQISAVSAVLHKSFIQGLELNFDLLLGKITKPTQPVDFESLTLIEDRELQAMMMIDGMVASARNLHLPYFISFNARLNAVIEGVHIDETNNPLDPQQITAAFSEALETQGFDQANKTSLLRSFNDILLKQLGKLLQKANRLLVHSGIIPDLGMDSIKPRLSPSRQLPRSNEPSQTKASLDEFSSVETAPYSAASASYEQPELFSLMQNLLHQAPAPASAGPLGTRGPTTVGPANAEFDIYDQQQPQTAQLTQQYAVPKAMIESHAASVMAQYQPAPGEQIEMVDQQQLIQILNSIQQGLDLKSQDQTVIPEQMEDVVNKLNLSESLIEVLEESREAGVISAFDSHSSDIINLVTLLYDAIWQDDSVPIPIKELIGRTQITIIKVALTDTGFFDREDHPARALLNEFAEAGIGWTEVANLKDDPFYQKIDDLVTRFQHTYEGDASVFETLIKEFRIFRQTEAANNHRLEQSILKAKARQEKLEDINELVEQKINERVLGRDLHPWVRDLLHSQFSKFMVLLLIKEGPTSNAWKQSINTIDVLLWSVQNHDQIGDRSRLEAINPRLLNNLRKAFRIAKLPMIDIDDLITRLIQVQDETFPDISQSVSEPIQGDAKAEFILDQPDFDIGGASQSLDDDNPVFDQVDHLQVGTWLEFAADEQQLALRCKLAAKINAIDKFIFVNRQGVKVIEKTRRSLAEALMTQTVRIISDGLLFSRAMEAVIGNLRETQHQQQTGNAYQPERSPRITMNTSHNNTNLNSNLNSNLNTNLEANL